MIYNHNIYFRHSHENVAVTFNLKNKVGDELLFEVMTSSGMSKTISTSKFKVTEMQKMQHAFLQISRMFPNVYIFEFISSDNLVKITIKNDENGHVVITFIIKETLSNSVYAEIKTELASLAYLVDEIQQCLDVCDCVYIQKNEFEECKQEACNLSLLAEEYFYEEDANQKFYKVNIYFSSSFVTFSLYFSLYDFEYIELLSHVNKKGTFQYYIRPLDCSGVDLSFHGHKHQITFQGSIRNIESGYVFSFCSNINPHLYDDIMNNLKHPKDNKGMESCLYFK